MLDALMAKLKAKRAEGEAAIKAFQAQDVPDADRALHELTVRVMRLELELKLEREARVLADEYIKAMNAERAHEIGQRYRIWPF